MKKVAIVTQEALDSKSFIWNVEGNKFQAKFSSLEGNLITQQLDGLSVVVPEGQTTPVYNQPSRVRFLDNTATLPHFDLVVFSNDGFRVDLITKDNPENIVVLSVSKNQNESPNVDYLNLGPLETHDLGRHVSFRIAYEYGGRIVVMDIFLTGSKDDWTKIDGFVDVVISANKADFNNIPNNLQ